MHFDLRARNPRTPHIIAYSRWGARHLRNEDPGENVLSVTKEGPVLCRVRPPSKGPIKTRRTEPNLGLWPATIMLNCVHARRVGSPHFLVLSPHLLPLSPRPKPDRLRPMRRLDALTTRQVRNRPRQLQDAMVRPCAHVHLLPPHHHARSDSTHAMHDDAASSPYGSTTSLPRLVRNTRVPF